MTDTADADDLLAIGALTFDDRADLAAIARSEDPAEIAALIHAYYHDLDRAERTPRGLLYIHLGLLTGHLDRLARRGSRARNGDQP
jgi:hypothetical protein